MIHGRGNFGYLARFLFILDSVCGTEVWIGHWNQYQTFFQFPILEKVINYDYLGADTSIIELAMKQPLTAVQSRVLNFIRQEIRSTGRSPSLTEIQEEFGYGSPHTPRFHVNNLVKAGYLNRQPGHRGLSLVGEMSGLRLAGIVAAGPPIEAIEDRDERIDLGGFSDENHFALRVRGESMIEEAIADGDLVVVRKQQTCSDGDLVVARIGEEATLKRFYREPRKRRIRLQPANSTMEPIFCREEEVTIEGMVVGVIRLMGSR